MAIQLKKYYRIAWHHIINCNACTVNACGRRSLRIPCACFAFYEAINAAATTARLLLQEPSNSRERVRLRRLSTCVDALPFDCLHRASGAQSGRMAESDVEWECGVCLRGRVGSRAGVSNFTEY